LGIELIFHFVFQKFNFVAWKIIEFPPQLSCSVNEVLSAVAVRENVSWPVRFGGSIRTKACTPAGRHETKKQVFRRKRLLKVEKSSFLHPFFCFGKKG
jgi:hypothetical protein